MNDGGFPAHEPVLDEAGCELRRGDKRDPGPGERLRGIRRDRPSEERGKRHRGELKGRREKRFSVAPALSLRELASDRRESDREHHRFGEERQRGFRGEETEHDDPGREAPDREPSDGPNDGFSERPKFPERKTGRGGAEPGKEPKRDKGE